MQHTLFIIAKVVTVALGSLIAFQAYRGYLRNDVRQMLYVAGGFLLISVGGVLEGLLFEVGGLTIFQAGFIATFLVAAGMSAILYALYIPSA